jgi:hypothetical protein
MKIFRRQASSGQFSSLDESNGDESSDSQLRPYSATTVPLRDRGIDTSSIFRSRWTASMPCLGDMSKTDVAAESLLSNEEEIPLPAQSLMEDEKLIVSLMEQEKLRHEADGLVIGETPVGWIRARQARHRMGNSVRTVKRAIKSIAARRDSDDEEHKHSTPISSDEDDDDDDDSIISFETKDFIRQLAMDDGDVRRGSESRRARRRHRLRSVRDKLKKTVLQGVSLKSRNVQERRAVSPEQVSGPVTTTFSADMIMGDPYCFDY